MNITCIYANEDNNPQKEEKKEKNEQFIDNLEARAAAVFDFLENSLTAMRFFPCGSRRRALEIAMEEKVVVDAFFVECSQNVLFLPFS
jgi:hypothetical protein